jgi:hypothetical protein
MIYVSTAPEYLNDVRDLGRPLLLMAYSFDRPFPEIGGPAGEAPPKLSMMAVHGDIRSGRAADIVRECRRHGLTGVVAGYGYSSVLETMRLAEALGRRNIRLYITEENYVSDCGARVLISTAISGGNLRNRLGEAAKRFGLSRLALDFERLRHVFRLPSPDGNGLALDEEEFDGLLKKADSPVVLSEELCCKYFTYSEDGETRFVLFDDIDTLKTKIELASSLGVKDGFVMYPEWDMGSLRLLNA